MRHLAQRGGARRTTLAVASRCRPRRRRLRSRCQLSGDWGNARSGVRRRGWTDSPSSAHRVKASPSPGYPAATRRPATSSRPKAASVRRAFIDSSSSARRRRSSSMKACSGVEEFGSIGATVKRMSCGWLCGFVSVPARITVGLNREPAGDWHGSRGRGADTGIVIALSGRAVDLPGLTCIAMGGDCHGRGRRQSGTSPAGPAAVSR